MKKESRQASKSATTLVQNQDYEVVHLFYELLEHVMRSDLQDLHNTRQ